MPTSERRSATSHGWRAGDQGYGDDDDDAYARADTALNEAVQVYDSTQELIGERLRTLVSGRRRGNQRPVRRVGAATFPNPFVLLAEVSLQHAPRRSKCGEPCAQRSLVARPPDGRPRDWAPAVTARGHATQHGHGGTPSASRRARIRQVLRRACRRASAPSPWLCASRSPGPLRSIDAPEVRYVILSAHLAHRTRGSAEKLRQVSALSGLARKFAHVYVACGHACSSAESRREFGVGADDCVSSGAGAPRAPEPRRSLSR
jgi:hypothetical protein